MPTIAGSQLVLECRFCDRHFLLHLQQEDGYILMKAISLKRTMSVFVCCLGMAALWSADSATEEPDSYESEDDYEDVSSPKSGKSSSFSASKLLDGFFGEDPIDLGDGSIFEYDLLGTKAVQKSVMFQYVPKDKEVCIKSKNLTGSSYVCFDEAAMNAVKKARDQYFKDFENKVLDKKAKKSYEAYGSCVLHYKSGLIGINYHAKPQTSLGYRFVKHSQTNKTNPYFTLTLWPAEPFSYDGVDVSDQDTSSRMTVMLTKQQLDNLVDFFDKEYLNSLVSDTVEEADEY